MTGTHSTPPMSPKRRFLTALLGGRPDRVPVGNVVSVATIDLMDAAQSWFPQAHLDPQDMARLAAAGHQLLEYDTVMPVFSVTQEAAALGCEVNWGAPNMMPGVRSYPCAEIDDWRLPDGWLDAPSIQVVLEALSLLRSSVGDQVVIVGKVMGPWSLSYHLMGLENFLISTILDPDRVRRSLDTLKAVTIAFARAQMQAGADIICLADHATGETVSPASYRDFLLPIHREIIPEMGCPLVLHCCGNTLDRLHYFAQAGFDCYHFESAVRVEDAAAALGGKMSLMGNINNPSLLMAGSQSDVIQACRDAISGGVDILSPECAVPLTTPTANLKALVRTARETARAI